MSNRKQKISSINLLKESGGDVSIKSFIPIIKQPKKKESTGKFKRSGHLTDQMLKYDYPKDSKGQLSIFDSLGDATKKDIETVGVERSEVVEGIKLTPSETKVIDSLCKLLHHNSQTVEPTEKNYYTGNLEPKVVEYGDSTALAPKLAFTLYELTKEYKGGDSISGKDVENVAKALFNIKQKNFLIRYKEETTKKGGAKIIKELEMFEPIIRLPNLKIREYNKEGIETSKTEETLVILHPIFIRQIDTKFLIYPDDINKRTIIAYGNNKVSEATFTLREYLAKHLAIKNYTPQINLDRLYYLLSEKYMRESRKSKVKQYTEKAIDTMIKLGLLDSYEVVTAKTTGEPKVIFTINKNFV